MTELRRLKIKNFKSLKDVDIEFDHLNVLIGMNGSGKSTVLQALDFVSQLMRGRIDDWLAQREWTIADLNCKLIRASNIEIEVTVQLNSGQELIWESHFNRQKLNCTFERFVYQGNEIFKVKNNQFILWSGEKSHDISFSYQGSVLSTIRFQGERNEHITRMLELSDFLKSVSSLELLAPNLLRKRARTTEKDIGSGGEKLSAFLGALTDEKHTQLLIILKTFYPKIVDFKISNLRSGWKQLTIAEDFDGHKVESEARHMNDGLLRILAILAQTQTAPSMLLLDEIENGVNQELVEKLVNVLLTARTQLIVTTHSPLILNYLPDDVAKKSVQFIYKSPEGATQIRRFFEIPRVAGKLDLMGAGDAFVDTNLIDLAQECHLLDALGCPAQ